MTPLRSLISVLSGGLLVRRSVGKNFLKGRKLHASIGDLILLNMYIEIITSASTGALEVKLEIMTHQLTDRQTDFRIHREVSLSIRG